MSRLQRVCPLGVPQHVVQRGNNRQDCFISSADRKAYLNWLKIFANQYSVDVHAWVLMTNHVHLLLTPNTKNAISKMMQSLGRMYVGYFNHAYNRSGTLWEGRFKSSVIQSEQYLLNVYRYIELNPVRANMVNQPNEYNWSSHSYNALGIENELITPHNEYLFLGSDAKTRRETYLELFENEINDELIKNIRRTVNKGLALGERSFINQIESLTSMRVSSRKAGRPKKKVKDNQ